MSGDGFLVGIERFPGVEQRPKDAQFDVKDERQNILRTMFRRAAHVDSIQIADHADSELSEAVPILQ